MDEELKKFRIIRNIALLFFTVLIISSLKLQLIEGGKYYRLSEENRIREKYLTPPRGKIFDRNNIEIANTRPGFYVSVTRAFVDEPSLKRVSTILNISRKTIKERLALQKNPFIPVKIAHDITYEQLAEIEESLEDLKDVQVGVEPLRNYPYKELLFHVIGYVGEVTERELKNGKYLLGDYVGRMGLEKFYEDQLQGKRGIEYIEVDAQGRELRKLSEKRPSPPISGKDLYTTLDVALTESVAVYLNNYERAACVCLDPRNGEVLVLYSKPGFDPNLFIHGIEKTQWQIINKDPNAPMFNRTIMSCYPPGSTFKPFIALAGLDSWMIDKNKHFEPCRGQLRLGRRIFRCWRRHGRLDLIGALIKSCDIYFYQLGEFLGIDTIFSRVKRVGFGSKLGIDLPNEKNGLLPDRSWFEHRYGKHWTLGHIFNLSIGQGDLLVTPLQLACAYTIFVNDGKIPIPHLLKGDSVRYIETGISVEAIKTVCEGLKGVVAAGTGRLARLEQYEVWGKTGTAQNPHGKDHALFVGLAPAQDPKILVCVVVENAGHGGSVAAPIAGRIIKAFLSREKNIVIK